MRFWNIFYSDKSSSNFDLLSKISDKYDSSISALRSMESYSLFSDFFYDLNYYFYCISHKITNLAAQLFSMTSFSIESHSYDSLIMSVKFLSLIALLIFIRGGIPRYRFDHLTKIGWIKFLSLVVASILIELLLIYFM